MQSNAIILAHLLWLVLPAILGAGAAYVLRRRKWLAVSSAVAVFATSACFGTVTGIRDRFTALVDPNGRVERAAHAAIHAALDEAGLTETYREYQKKVGGDEKGYSLAYRGLKRLGEESIETRIGLANALIHISGEKFCGDYFLDNTSIEERERALNRLSEIDLDTYFKLNAEAMVLELKQTPAPEVAQAEIDKALESLYENLSHPESDRLKAFFADIVEDRPLIQKESCWAAKTYLKGLAVLTPELRNVLARQAPLR